MAGVIRREAVCAAPAFSFEDLDRQARAVLDRAEAQARRILQDAEQRAARLMEQRGQEGRQRGLEEGRRAGAEQVRGEIYQSILRETRQEFQRLTETLGAALTEFERNKQRLLAAAESGVIELALAIAWRVCKIAVGTSSETAWANARSLLELVRHDADAELRFNPDELALLQETALEFLKAAGRLDHVKIAGDAAVARGGCVLAMKDGTADAGIETQLERIAEALTQSARDHE